MKIAVIGGGIFGCTAAIHLKREGHDVDLYEAKDSILRCASTCNQYRLHRGYHYPRSPETIAECRDSLESFRKEFPEAVVDRGSHLYAIARENSKITPGEYLDALDKNGLEYEIGSSALLSRDAIELVVKVKEPWLDLVVLRGLMWDKLRGVAVTTNYNIGPKGDPMNKWLREYDRIVIASYSQTNHIASALGCRQQEFQFEVVEKPVLKMPDEFRDVGIVVMDGPFCSLDPMCNTPYHVMGHVEWSIHSTNVGREPKIRKLLGKYLDRGVIPYKECREFSNLSIDDWHWGMLKFIPGYKNVENIGSMFTVRAVLPNKNETDERPTLVEELDDQVIRVFSGKIGTAVEAAKQVCDLVRHPLVSEPEGVYCPETQRVIAAA